MRAKILFLLSLFAISAASATAQTRTPRKTLDIYVVDVEGGNSVLFVSPSGESVLIDTGNVAPGAVRDAERIMAAAKDAGLTQIDHLIITHWHGDHFGGLAELATRIPIKEFIDHGANAQPTPQTDEFLQKTYPALYANAKHTVVKPGDKIPVAGLDWRDRDFRRAGASRSPLARRRQTQSVLRQLQAGREQRGGSAIRRILHRVWKIPHRSSGGSDEEQGIRTDVPE